MYDAITVGDKHLNATPPVDQEREAFIRMDPAKFFIRHPPPPDKLNDFQTPDELLFQTLHMGAAEVNNDKWVLVINGMVEKPFSINLEQLLQLPSKTITSFQECYGSPLVPPTKALRRIGNAVWTGVPLRDLLEIAILKPDARFVWSEGLDRGEFAGVQADRYQKDLPIDKALSPEVLVAYEMNSELLSRNRGGPVRLVVPGWFGTNSTKWLSKLTVQDRRAPSPFTTTFYNEVHPPDAPNCASRPIWKVQPNSMIVVPSPDSRTSANSIPVEGWAWSEDGVKLVDISADEGQTWARADIDERTEFSWQRFRTKMELPPGWHTILAKATGTDGREQPLGEGRNHVHRVTINVI
ncbi:hypothetical protein LTR37_020604 [Vermiconidia calcicola]|uniref:Uncharacterized protein n=1 Tax=Vermiconidia calcicola TaxID=1690605 RepID=A0ACC3MCT6_9PEZI|nr:hypothetical protein LTR37_020604 [Vermiconidia calcicola]